MEHDEAVAHVKKLKKWIGQRTLTAEQRTQLRQKRLRDPVLKARPLLDVLLEAQDELSILWTLKRFAK